MDNDNLRERVEGAEALRDFEGAGNANVMQAAGEGLEANRTVPTPGSRLSTAEVQAEAGWRPDQGNAEKQGPDKRETESSVKADEREAIRRQGPQDTDSDLDPDQLREQQESRGFDPVITTNPD